MKYKLKDVCNFYSGTGFPTKYQGEIEGDYPFYKVGDITNNVIAGNIYLEMCNNYVSIDTVKKIKGCVLPPNTVVFAKIGEALKLNRRAITSCACLIDNNAMGIAPKEDTLRIQYFYFFMKNLKMQVLAESTTVPSVRKTILEDYEVEIPSLNIQEEIESRLTIIQDIIEKQKKELSLLDNLIKARFVEMFESVQETCEIGYYIKALIAGKSLAGESECENKVLKTGAVSFDYFDASQIKNLPVDYKPQKEHLVNVGDLIISRMNTAELTGATAYVWSVPDKVYIPDRLWKAILEEKCNPIFVWQMLIQPSTKEQIQRECSGTSGSMKNISKAGMLGIKVKKVNIDMQNDFADFVKQVDKSKVAVQKALDETKLLFDSLMQKYFG